VPTEFPTPSGKIEFYSEQLEEAGFDPVPRFTRPAEPPSGFFRLLYGRSPVHTFARTQSNPLLGEMMGENEVWIHADSARELGLATGDRVRLENQDGIVSDPVKVKATQRIRRDSVYLVHGFGQQSRAFRGVHGRGAADAQLITRYAVDPLMGATGMRVNFVTIVAES
jgi:thiosulfate reductase/polysulfide reductase chain A